MKITHVEVHRIDVPTVDPPFRWRDGLSGSAPVGDGAVLRIGTDEGAEGVALFDALLKSKIIAGAGDDVRWTKKGEDFARGFRIDIAALKSARRPICKPCLDWSQRRRHLAGGFGAALLEQFLARKWLTRAEGRVLAFTRAGRLQFRKLTEPH